jgi:hypothetical protein
MLSRQANESRQLTLLKGRENPANFLLAKFMATGYIRRSSGGNYFRYENHLESQK